MKCVLTVKGMMCPHCEAHCRAALEKVDGVVSAQADHKACTVTVACPREAPESQLRAAVKSAGYEYCGKQS